MKTIGGEPVMGANIKTERMSLVMELSDKARLEEFAKRNGLRSSSSALRALIRIGLEASEAAKAEGRVGGGAAVEQNPAT